MKGKYFEMLPGLNRDSVKLGFSHVLFIPFLNLGATQSSTEDLEDGVGEKQANICFVGSAWGVVGHCKTGALRPSVKNAAHTCTAVPDWAKQKAPCK